MGVGSLFMCCVLALLLGLQYNIGYDHLLHRDSAVLERVLVVAHKAVGIVRIDQEIAVVGEDVARREASRW